jgi:tetratricopeptide (TPR) repeat protein
LLDEALILHKGVAERDEIAAALNNLGLALCRNGELAAGRSRLEESLTIRQALGDMGKTARTLLSLGVLTMRAGAFAQAAQHFEESAALFRQTTEDSNLAMALNDWAVILEVQGELQRAAEVGAQSLEKFRALGQPYGIAVTLETLGTIAYSRADFERALAYAQESVSRLRALGHHTFTSAALALLGLVLCGQDRAPEAAPLLTEAMHLQSDAIHVSDPHRRPDGETLYRLAHLADLLGQLELATTLYHRCLEQERAVGSRWHAAPCLEGLARVAVAHGTHGWAVRLSAAAATLRALLGMPLPPVARALVVQTVTQARSALTPRSFAVAWARGLAMPSAVVIGEALAAAKSGAPACDADAPDEGATPDAVLRHQRLRREPDRVWRDIYRVPGGGIE